MEETPQRVLVVIPHPDDAEIWCGGTLARWIGQGAEVVYVVCTDGGKGTDKLGITAEELAATRDREQMAAADVLGVSEIVKLGYPDGELEDTGDFRKHLVRQIRRVQPEVVMAAEPYVRSMVWHRDRRIAGQVALDAVFPYARDHLHFGELWSEEGLEPHKTGAVLFWGTEQANTFIDIGETMEVKLAAVQAHQSQVADHPEREVVDYVYQRARDAGAQGGCEYAEAFRRVNFRTG